MLRIVILGLVLASTAAFSQTAQVLDAANNACLAHRHELRNPRINGGRPRVEWDAGWNAKGECDTIFDAFAKRNAADEKAAAETVANALKGLPK